MGLEKAEQSAIPSIIPKTPHTRRVFLDVVGRRIGEAAIIAGFVPLTATVAAEVNQQILPPSTRIAEKDPQKILQLTGLVLAELGKAYRAEVDLAAASDKATQALGFQISNAYLAQDGFGYMWFQRGALQFQTNGNGEFTVKPRLWNNLDELHNAGFDQQLDNGSLGVTVPSHKDFGDGTKPGETELAFQRRVEHFKAPSDIASFVQGIRNSGFETGAFTSELKDYGPYRVIRTQRIAVQRWEEEVKDAQGNLIARKGDIMLILIGDAAKKAGFIPKEVQLPQPLKINFAGGAGNGNGTVNGTEIFAPASKDIVTLGGKAKYHVIGDGIKLTLSDPVLYEQIFGPLIEEYQDTGLDAFLYTKKIAPNSISWADSGQLWELQNRLQNYQSDIIYFGGFTNSFLGNTSVATGIRRTDGVREIHMGLFPKPGANPTPEDIREHSHMLTELLARAIVGFSFATQGGSTPDLIKVIRMLGSRGANEPDKPFPLTITLALS